MARIFWPNWMPLLVKPLKNLYVSGYRFNVNHKGTDYGLVQGENVYAAHTGIVTWSGWDKSGYGLALDIKSAKYKTLYAHLLQVVVSTGEKVTAGQLIAYGDSTGNSTGPHLHFEMAIYGVKVNPEKFLS